ncbi:MAG: hypothetical protein ACFFD4_03175 [Candidatus Odinarchaeota archaeon]
MLVNDSIEEITHGPALLEDCKLIFFKQTLAGLEPIRKDVSVPFSSIRPRSDIEKLASFFVIAVGQGDCFAEGLYGPLPALNSGYEVLLFAKLVPDKKNFDPRMKGQNYTLFCFFYPKVMEFLVNSRRFRFSAEIMTFLSDVDDVEQITVNKLKELEKRLKFIFI